MEKEPVLVLVTLQHACARLIREGVDLAPVSYTHLDVYKRQGPVAGGGCLRAIGRRAAGRFAALGAQVPHDIEVKYRDDAQRIAPVEGAF